MLFGYIWVLSVWLAVKQTQEILVKRVVLQVLHKAVVEVNEQGSEAAAATAVIMKARMRVQEFKVDYPFLFCIRDNRSGAVLFLGRVYNPNSGN